MSTVKDFSGYTPTWCPGCGDWAIGSSTKKALVELGYDASGVAVSFDIGCSGNMNDFLNAYASHGLHGRSLVTAVGMKLANHKLPVVVVGGDGGLYGEGGNHFLHACRGNHDLTVIAHDNSVYGLTTGQVAPTALKGAKSKSTPAGIIEVPVNPLTLALTQGATFIAQGFAADIPQIIELIKAGIRHKGFALVNILQPCVTFNKLNTYQYYIKNSYKLPKEYNPADYREAFRRAEEMNQQRFALGIIYQTERPAYHEQLPQLAKQSLLEREPFNDISSLVQTFV